MTFKQLVDSHHFLAHMPRGFKMYAETASEFADAKEEMLMMYEYIKHVSMPEKGLISIHVCDDDYLYFEYHGETKYSNLNRLAGAEIVSDGSYTDAELFWIILFNLTKETKR